MFAGVKRSDLFLQTEGFRTAECCGFEHFAGGNEAGAAGPVAGGECGETRLFEQVADVVAGDGIAAEADRDASVQKLFKGRIAVAEFGIRFRSVSDTRAVVCDDLDIAIRNRYAMCEQRFCPQNTCPLQELY